MRTESIDYKDGDVSLRGFLAYDEAQAGQRPGILVMPGGFGLGNNAKKRAQMLAALGYVAFAGGPVSPLFPSRHAQSKKRKILSRLRPFLI